MKGRVLLGREFWREAIAKQAASGLSVAAYCREHELVPVTFYKWRMQLRISDSVASSPGDTDSTDAKAGPSASSAPAVSSRRKAAARRAEQASLVELILSPHGGADEAAMPHGASVVEVSLSGGVFMRFHGVVCGATMAAAIEAIGRLNPRGNADSLQGARSVRGAGQ